MITINKYIKFVDQIVNSEDKMFTRTLFSRLIRSKLCMCGINDLQTSYSHIQSQKQSNYIKNISYKYKYEANLEKYGQ